MGDEDAIRERLAAATPGPWRLQNAETYAVAPTRFYIGSELRGIVETRRGDAQARTDAVFIAHAPEDIAALLAENATLRAALVEERARRVKMLVAIKGALAYAREELEREGKL